MCIYTPGKLGYSATPETCRISFSNVIFLVDNLCKSLDNDDLLLLMMNDDGEPQVVA